jgi:type I restriction enzyme R subunit
MLRQEVLEEDEIDLSAVILSHYSLRAKRTQDLKLKEDAQGYGLQGISAVGSAKAREEKKDFLSHILEQLNDLFGTEVTDGDKLDWLQGMASKIAENQPLMEQVRNNSRDAIMLGDFPKAVDAAVIERMDTQNGMSLDYLSRPDAANRIQSLLLDILLKGLQIG